MVLKEERVTAYTLLLPSLRRTQVYNMPLVRLKYLLEQDVRSPRVGTGNKARGKSARCFTSVFPHRMNVDQ